MSDQRIGFLVVNRRTGFIIEGKEHAARVFDTERQARSACNPIQPQVPAQLTYDDLVKALISGTTFCFEGTEAYGRFIKHLSHDASNRPFLIFSHNKARVRWRHEPVPAAT